MDDTSLAPVNLDVQKTVKKSNILNELRNANASLVEYRLFCVYLAHLQMNNDSNVVTFTLADYTRIAGLKRPRAYDLEEQSDNLLDMKARIPTPDGGFRKLNLFSEFSLFKKDGEWMVSLECTQNIAPMIREQTGKFLRYKLYNTIFLKSYNQHRLYELLKQYERIGERTITLPDLRDFLSIEEHQYPVWGVFARDVLKVAQQSINENTDICFDFEPIRASKRGKPVVAVKFTITKNRAFVDRLQIEQHMPDIDGADDYDGEELYKRAPEEDDENQMTFFDVTDVAEAICKSVLPRFSQKSIHAIAASIASYFASLLPNGVSPSKGQIAAYIKQKVAELEVQKEKQNIPYPAAYLNTMIQTDAKKAIRYSPENQQSSPESPRVPDEDEIRSIKRMMAEEPATIGSCPELAARAAELKEKLQNT